MEISPAAQEFVDRRAELSFFGLRKDLYCLLARDETYLDNPRGVVIYRDELDDEDLISFGLIPRVAGSYKISFSTLNKWDVEIHARVIMESIGRSLSHHPPCAPWYVGIMGVAEVEYRFSTNFYNIKALVRKEVMPLGGGVFVYLSLYDGKLITHLKILEYQSDDCNEFESISKHGYYYIPESPISNEFFICLSHLVQTYSSPPRITTSWVFSERNLHNYQRIGNGTFGDVNYGIWHKSKFEYVNVMIKKGSVNGMPRGEFMNHVKLLATLSHPNIATFYGVRTHLGLCILIQEFLMSLSLRRFLTEIRLSGIVLNLTDVIKIICQLADGMEYLESRGIFYRNLSVRNVRVMDELECKITDFGFEKICLLRTDKCGNLVSAESQLSWKNDMVAFGTLMYDIFTCAKHSDKRYDWALIDDPDVNSFPARPESCPPKMYTTIEECWKFNTFKQSRPFFSRLKTLLNS